MFNLLTSAFSFFSREFVNSIDEVINIYGSNLDFVYKVVQTVSLAQYFVFYIFCVFYKNRARTYVCVCVCVCMCVCVCVCEELCKIGLRLFLIMALKILRAITRNIQQAKFYSIMRDKTCDVSNKQQLVLGIP